MDVFWAVLASVASVGVCVCPLLILLVTLLLCFMFVLADELK